MGRIPTIYYCPYENCNASYDRKHRYDTHIRSHTGERPFICSHEGCGKSYASSSHLKRHEDTHGSSYRCTVKNCPEILKTKATLKKHIRKVHLKIERHKVYTCTQCGKEFNKHNTLQMHELRHSGQLPHKCSVENCQKAFLTPSKLKRHMKIHEGYPCKVPGCDQVFEKWSLYVQHGRDCHRPEHKCPKCDKTFSRSSALKLHVPLHEESRLVYPCEVPNCSQYYFVERNLKLHMKKYHSKRPFMCDKENCHRAFKTEADLADHISNHDKKKPRKKKNKPKKIKPTLAALLSGVAEVKRVNRKPKQALEEKQDLDIACSKLDLTDLELSTNKILSADSLEPNQSSTDEHLCILNNEQNVSSVSSGETSQSNPSIEKEISLCPNSSNDSSVESETAKLSSQEKILELNKSTTLDSYVCSTENHVEMGSEINNSSLEVPESIFQGYTSIEVIGSGNQPQLISVPIIQIDDQHWNKNVAVTIETVS